MKPLIFTFSHDRIFKGVKQEASLLAERRTDTQGNSLFEDLVFDEEYDIKFRELFSDAQANVVAALSAYMKEIPSDTFYYDNSGITDECDFHLYLFLPEEFLPAMAAPLQSKIREYLTAFILYRWLETKSPADAQMFFERSYRCLEDIQTYPRKNISGLRRTPRWF